MMQAVRLVLGPGEVIGGWLVAPEVQLNAVGVPQAKPEVIAFIILSLGNQGTHKRLLVPAVDAGLIIFFLHSLAIDQLVHYINSSNAVQNIDLGIF